MPTFPVLLRLRLSTPPNTVSSCTSSFRPSVYMLLRTSLLTLLVYLPRIYCFCCRWKKHSIHVLEEDGAADREAS